MINIEKDLEDIFALYIQHQEYFQAVSINTTFKNPYVKLFYLEKLAYQLSYGREELVNKIQNTRKKWMEYFEEYPEEANF